MKLAIFDLDNTLLAGDSDYLWGEFLAEKKIVDRDFYSRENQRFYDEYKAGTLDIFEFLAFSLKPLTTHSMEELQALHNEFMHSKINEIWLPKAETLIQEHRQQDHYLLIITATNHFVTEPIASQLGVDDLLATMPEKIDNRYTGKVDGTPCFQEGKVTRLQHWLKEHELTLEGSYFYSDSFNDLPLLSIVTHPVAVDPDIKLKEHALKEKWPIISLR